MLSEGAGVMPNGPGFDVLWNCDTVVEPDRPRHTMFDGPATLTMMAADTRRIRIGTLVTSLYFRQPVTFAKAAMTVDHLSGGRVELALGVGGGDDLSRAVLPL
jgi:alkanesulfonate monooxygenase SsuD/methylene tetrahydromethanopterin reductase-like flavin-dependent oxidoreductase (luciferase family)